MATRSPADPSIIDPSPRRYRPNVGIALFNAQGQVLMARRIADDGPEVLEPGCAWQMPQGGVDAGEDLVAAARRELREETGIVSASLLGHLSEPLNYDWPPYDGPPHRLDGFAGQRQHWFAFRFEGAEAEIDFGHAAPGEAIEFDAWRWERLDAIAAQVVSYKRAIYTRIAHEFAAFAQVSG